MTDLAPSIPQAEAWAQYAADDGTPTRRLEPAEYRRVHDLRAHITDRQVVDLPATCDRCRRVARELMEARRGMGPN